MLQRAQQAVVRGGHERRGDGLADQVLGLVDLAAVAHHQRLGGVDLRRDDESDDRQTARCGSGQWAGADIAELHVAGGDGRDHFRAAVETAPVEFFADGLFIGAIGLGNLGRVDAGLVAEGDVGLGGAGDTGEGQRGQQPAREESATHDVLLMRLFGDEWFSGWRCPAARGSRPWHRLSSVSALRRRRRRRYAAARRGCRG
ncbi:hypothetical protein D3C78_614300 [compost metagenome]